MKPTNMFRTIRPTGTIESLVCLFALGNTALLALVLAAIVAALIS